MSQENKAPFVCHVFVCTNDRHGERKSCADGDNVEVRQALKQAIADKGLKGRVRVSQSGCLGLCEDGPNVIMYPQKIWLCGVKKNDISEIVTRIEKTVSDSR